MGQCHRSGQLSYWQLLPVWPSGLSWLLGWCWLLQVTAFLAFMAQHKMNDPWAWNLWSECWMFTELWQTQLGPNRGEMVFWTLLSSFLQFSITHIGCGHCASFSNCFADWKPTCQLLPLFCSLMTRVAFLRALGTVIKLTEEQCRFCIENIHFRDACGYPLKKRTLFPGVLQEIELKNSKASVRPAFVRCGPSLSENQGLCPYNRAISSVKILVLQP